MKVLTFDIEIKNKVPMKNEPPTRYTYCDGWGDYENMGISFLGVHTSWDNRLTFFDENNLPDMVPLLTEADVITGYNILGFDIPLLKATLVRKNCAPFPAFADKIYDIFYDIRKNKKGTGWKLDDVAKHTLNISKSGDGAKAPELWQDGDYAELINYLAQDVRVEAALFNHVFKYKQVTNGVKTIQLTEIEKFNYLDLI